MVNPNSASGYCRCANSPAKLTSGNHRASTRKMKLQGIILFLLVAGLGMYFLRFCSNRFMMLRRAKSFTPYLYGIGGILSLMLITLAFFAMLLVFLGPLH
jgi:hypothetical protein